MALKTKYGTFVHVIKCGGQSVRTWIGPGTEIGDYHGLPADIEDGFMLVRHPVSWLRSLWAYRNNSGWAIKEPIVRNWNVIFGLTQWLKGTSWEEFVHEIYMHDLDIPYIVYGMYRHPKVKVYKLEFMENLLSDIGLDPGLAKTKIHYTTNLPEITRGQRQALASVCRRSISEYDY